MPQPLNFWGSPPGRSPAGRNSCFELTNRHNANAYSIRKPFFAPIKTTRAGSSPLPAMV